jgi:O-antigen ligase
MLPESFWLRMTTIFDTEQDKLQYTGSAEQRELVMGDGINAFLEYPITGVGAGQFKNYNPEGRQARFLETHNVLLQVAAETGIFGLLAFLFLIWRAALAAWVTTSIVRSKQWMSRSKDRGQQDTARALGEHTLGLSAGLIGWFVCAMFASVAYNWTFYYVLALLVAARELALVHTGAPFPAKPKNIPVRTPALSPQTAS